MNVTLTEIREKWTINDLMAAHDYLDAIEEAEAKHRRRRRARSS